MWHGPLEQSCRWLLLWLQLHLDPSCSNHTPGLCDEHVFLFFGSVPYLLNCASFFLLSTTATRIGIPLTLPSSFFILVPFAFMAVFSDLSKFLHPSHSSLYPYCIRHIHSSGPLPFPPLSHCDTRSIVHVHLHLPLPDLVRYSSTTYHDSSFSSSLPPTQNHLILASSHLQYSTVSRFPVVLIGYF